MHKMLLIALPLITACSTAPPLGHPDPTGPGAGPGHLCREAGLSSFVEQQASASVGAEILERSGARTLRWIPHDGAITMDLRADRVNVRLDPRSRIESVTCG